MPIKDPERRKQVSKEWRESRMKAGYGKALYRMRQLRLRNEVTLRLAVVDAVELLEAGLDHRARGVLEKALKDAPAVTGTPMDYMPEGVAEQFRAEVREGKVRAGKLGAEARWDGSEGERRVRTRFRPDGQVRQWKTDRGGSGEQDAGGQGS